GSPTREGPCRGWCSPRLPLRWSAASAPSTSSATGSPPSASACCSTTTSGFPPWTGSRGRRRGDELRVVHGDTRDGTRRRGCPSRPAPASALSEPARHDDGGGGAAAPACAGLVLA